MPKRQSLWEGSASATQTVTKTPSIRVGCNEDGLFVCAIVCESVGGDKFAGCCVRGGAEGRGERELEISEERVLEKVFGRSRRRRHEFC